MARTGASAHPDDETLSMLVDDTSSGDAGLQQHVAACEQCRGRLDEQRALRRVLQTLGAHASAPPDDLTRRVIGRLRMRHGAIGSVNEVLAAVRALLQGLSSLFGGAPPADGAGRSGSLPHG